MAEEWTPEMARNAYLAAFRRPKKTHGRSGLYRSRFRKAMHTPEEREEFEAAYGVTLDYPMDPATGFKFPVNTMKRDYRDIYKPYFQGGHERPKEGEPVEPRSYRFRHNVRSKELYKADRRRMQQEKWQAWLKEKKASQK